MVDCGIVSREGSCIDLEGHLLRVFIVMDGESSSEDKGDMTVEKNGSCPIVPMKLVYLLIEQDFLCTLVHC